MVTPDPGQTFAPAPPSKNSPLVTTSPIVSTPREFSPSQFSLPTKGTISSMGHTLLMGPPTVNTPSSYYHHGCILFRLGRSFMGPTSCYYAFLCIHLSRESITYGSSISSTSTIGVFYPRISYPINYYVPWGNPNWSNVPSYG